MMEFKQLTAGNKTITEVVSDEVVVKNVQDLLDIIGNLESNHVVFHSHQFEDDFYDLSTKKLGEILQKLANYQVKAAIVGDFNKYPSKTLKEFIYESNKFGNYLFVPSVEDVIKRWQ